MKIKKATVELTYDESVEIIGKANDGADADDLMRSYVLNRAGVPEGVPVTISIQEYILHKARKIEVEWVVFD